MKALTALCDIYIYIYTVARLASWRKFLVPALTAPGVGALCSDVTYRCYAPTAHESTLAEGELMGKKEERSKTGLCLSLFRKNVPTV
jgi:hypothetical protein